jgi:hypothetical protein
LVGGTLGGHTPAPRKQCEGVGQRAPDDRLERFNANVADVQDLLAAFLQMQGEAGADRALADARSSSRARVSEEPFGTLASVRQRERCLVGTVWPRMAGAVGRVMNVERVRLFLGAPWGGLGDSAIPFLDVARGRPVQPLRVTLDGCDPRHIRVYGDQLFVTPTAADEHWKRGTARHGRRGVSAADEAQK